MGQIKQAPPIYPYHHRTSDEGIALTMLMAVNQKPGPATLDVTTESAETLVRLAMRIIVDAQRRIMRQKHVHGRKGRQRVFNFLLFVKMVTARFVTQAPAKPGEAYPAEHLYLEM